MNQQSTATYLEPAAPREQQIIRWAGAFLATFSSHNTRTAYQGDLTRWFEFCHHHQVDPLDPDLRRSVVDAYMRHMETQGLAPATRGRRLSTVSSFYGYLYDESMMPGNPAARVRPPKRDNPVLAALDRSEMHRFLEACDQLGSYRRAILVTMSMCALRVSEATNSNVTSIREEKYVAVLDVLGKGDKRRQVVIPPRAGRTIEDALEGRTHGPLFLNLAGARMTRRNVHDAIRNALTIADIHKNLTPHGLRRSAIQIALDTGSSLQAVQTWVGHASPDTTLGYDRRPLSPDKSPGWAVMQAVA